MIFAPVAMQIVYAEIIRKNQNEVRTRILPLLCVQSGSKKGYRKSDKGYKSFHR